MKTFDLTPDPKVLLALTHTPMQPLDALCELIDNAIDSFQAAALQGNPIKNQLILINLPKPSEIQIGSGRVSIRDNGPGLSKEKAELALRAGFSGNNSYDSLGLFGMGFNISTGKIGRKTRFFTAQKEEKQGIEVIVDLEKMRSAKTFKVPVNDISKPPDFTSGTNIEISEWWPDGNPNSGFVKKLVQYGMPKVRQEIGRRYASFLRKKDIQIIINDEKCEPYEHCVWNEKRFVENKHGQIHAKILIDKTVGAQTRCLSCNGLVESGKKKCPNADCGSSSLRTIDEKIHGWVGIQRFDDPTRFGIDLIRNGRAIRIGEKSAFFEFIDEFKEAIKDYPIDGPYGRIVGEIHLNHVPVDFLKQDFQRSSPEWQRAMEYLRGNSSLQPTKPGAELNVSPVFRLFQGYRRVRKIGRGDMYMGYWSEVKNAPDRISREVEKEYYDKFLQKLPGFYDDTEWWKLVEQAEQRPLEELITCPGCNCENLKGHDVCSICSFILNKKTCINTKCKKEIAASAKSCEFCGESQVPEIILPWKCNVCGKNNPAEAATCADCASPQDSLPLLSKERLFGLSNKSDDLSIDACTIKLADGSYSNPIKIESYIMKEPLRVCGRSDTLPQFSLKNPDSIVIFLDLQHSLFKSLKVRPEYLISSEAALFIFDSNRRLSGSQNEGIHSLAFLTWQVLNKRWRSALEESPELLRKDISSFFMSIREKAPSILQDKIEDIYGDLGEANIKVLVDNMLSQGVNIESLKELKNSGEFLRFVDESVLINSFKHYPEKFFDGNFWSNAWNKIGDVSESIRQNLQSRTKSLYLNCLEDVNTFLKNKLSDPITIQRARASLLILQKEVM